MFVRTGLSAVLYRQKALPSYQEEIKRTPIKQITKGGSSNARTCPSSIFLKYACITSVKERCVKALLHLVITVKRHICLRINQRMEEVQRKT